MIPDRPQLLRQRFWQGQTLRSADFDDLRSLDEQRRWWHNRSLHDAFGVSRGFEVKIEKEIVTIGPGIAFDHRGRELFLRLPSSKSLPSDEVSLLDLTLLIRGKSPDEATFGFWQNQDPFRHEPEIRLLPTRQVVATDGLPIARFVREFGEGRRQNWKRHQDFKVPKVRPLARNRIFSGLTIPGKTNWQPWEVNISTRPDKETSQFEYALTGIEVEIDASAAAFTKTPCYFAWLQTEAKTPNNQLPFFYTKISETSPTSFVYSLIDLSPQLLMDKTTETVIQYYKRVTGHETRVKNIAALMKLANDTRFHVCWFGIEHQGRRKRGQVK